MKKILSSIIIGIACGAIMSIPVGAATIIVEGQLYTSNPVYSAPKGYATTAGYNSITAKCSVSKSGYNTKSVSVSQKCNKGSQGYIETDWVSGPTWKSSGTKFTSKHTGYTYDGDYKTLCASKEF